jgi:hypothetical protein
LVEFTDGGDVKMKPKPRKNVKFNDKIAALKAKMKDKKDRRPRASRYPSLLPTDDNHSSVMLP